MNIQGYMKFLRRGIPSLCIAIVVMAVYVCAAAYKLADGSPVLGGCGIQHAVSPLLTGVLSGAGSLISGLFGSIFANQRRKKAEQLLDKQKQKLKDWRDSELRTNYLDRADARAAMRRVFEYNKEAQKAANTDAIKRGMTDEAKVAQAAKLNRNYADTVSQISGVGAQHKDRVQQQYMNESRNLENLKIQNLMDTSGVDNMVQGVTGALGGLGTALSSPVGGTVTNNNSQSSMGAGGVSLSGAPALFDGISTGQNALSGLGMVPLENGMASNILSANLAATRKNRNRNWLKNVRYGE